MLTWLLLGIVVYYVQVFSPALFKFLDMGLADYLGKRDNEKPLTGVAGRLDKALGNMKENFIPFAALAVAALALGLGENSQAILGAQIFVIARLVYFPLYAAAVPVIRSLAATVGWVGMALMAAPLIAA